MAYAHEFLPLYRHVFDIPAARVKKGGCRSADDRLAECEFGPTGRSPRYPSGWFILPTLVVGAVILGFLL